MKAMVALFTINYYFLWGVEGQNISFSSNSHPLKSKLSDIILVDTLSDFLTKVKSSLIFNISDAWDIFLGTYDICVATLL